MGFPSIWRCRRRKKRSQVMWRREEKKDETAQEQDKCFEFSLSILLLFHVQEGCHICLHNGEEGLARSAQRLLPK